MEVKSHVFLLEAQVNNVMLVYYWSYRLFIVDLHSHVSLTFIPMCEVKSQNLEN